MITRIYLNAYNPTVVFTGQLLKYKAEGLNLQSFALIHLK